MNKLKIPENHSGVSKTLKYSRRCSKLSQLKKSII